ncbi:hypothetical protein O6H91_01G127900 [Diphasiastrum complanatum]|nr:hypothetical protein O6H91_01G127900 [Diphasiastrum complanatum]
MSDSSRSLGVMPHSLLGAYSPEIRKQSENFNDLCNFKLENVHDRRVLAIFNHRTIMEVFQRFAGPENAVDVHLDISDCGKLTNQLEWGKLIQQQVKVSDLGNAYKPMGAGQIKRLMPGLQHQNFPLEASSVKRKRKKKMNKHKQRKLRRRDRHRK